MLRHRTSFLTACLLASIAFDAAGQFNPEGRRRTRPKVTVPNPPSPNAVPKAKAEPSKAALIARYQAIVLSQPGARFPLQRLAQLYRERDGNIDQLIALLEARAAEPGPEHYNALLALAGAYREQGNLELARSTFHRALTEKPGETLATMALAELWQSAGDTKRALELFEQALPKLKGADLEQTLRTVMALCLDRKDIECARQRHKQLVQLAKGSFFVEAELGRELLQRQMFPEAVTEYERVVRLARGDNRVLAPALRDLGRAYAKLGKPDQALQHLKRALAAAGGAAGVRRDVYDAILEVHRGRETLPELVKELEAQRAGDQESLRLLGKLYEETGKLEKAISTYRRVLRSDQKDIGTRVRVVQLLQVQGQLGQVVDEFQALIRAAPNNPDFVFQLAEALIQQGERQRALSEIAKLERRSLREEEILAAVADFYERVGESERALEVMKRLANLGSSDPQHLVELGSRFYREGNQVRAKKVWQRIKTVVPDKAEALFVLGEVYLDHDMAFEGLEALREAMKLEPGRVKYKKGYARALERSGADATGRTVRVDRYAEALKVWHQLLEGAGADQNLAREARRHIITLWALSGQLASRIEPLERALGGSPPNIEAGRLLAEANMRQRDYKAAERTLRRVIKSEPGDVNSLLELERALVSQHKEVEAIDVLKRLVEAEPSRAREYYQRMAKYAADAYQDDSAIRYAERAVELSPDDASAHQKLGEMYRKRQDTPRAVAAFRRALAKNDRLFAVHLQLAELLLGEGNPDEADQLLRRVIRAAPDDELVSLAARLSMQVNLGQGTLESLEKELLSVALGNPKRQLYRRLLVEIYGAMAFPLVHQEKSDDPAVRQHARNELSRIGERAVKPLLDALLDERESQQRVAIELLGHIKNKGAGPALFSYAQKADSPALSTRAMLAAGSLRDPALLDRFRALLTSADGELLHGAADTLLALVWSVAQLDGPRSGALLTDLLDHEDGEVRALAALGLGVARYRPALAKLEETARSTDVGPLPRAAAAFAVGAIGRESSSSVLVELSRATDPLVRVHAILAMARMGLESAPRAVAEALFSQSETEREGGITASLVLATGRFQLAADPLSSFRDRMSVEASLARLVPVGYPEEAYAKALVRLAEPLQQVSLGVMSSSPEGALLYAEALLARGGQPAFGRFTQHLADVEAQQREAAEAVARTLAESAVKGFVVLSRHPNATIRRQSLLFLAHRHEDVANRELARSLLGPDPDAQRQALAAVEVARNVSYLPALVKVLLTEEAWAVRAAAARALGELLGSDDEGARFAAATERRTAALKALAARAKTDRYALVREACLLALARAKSPIALDSLTFAAEHDKEPLIRIRAKKLMAQPQ